MYRVKEKVKVPNCSYSTVGTRVAPAQSLLGWDSQNNHPVFLQSSNVHIVKNNSYLEWSVRQGPCRELKPCVECQAFGSGQLKEVSSKHLLLPIFTCTADPVSQKR